MFFLHTIYTIPKSRTNDVTFYAANIKDATIFTKNKPSTRAYVGIVELYVVACIAR